MAERLTEPLPVSPAAATPRVDFDDTLGRAIDAGRLDPALADADGNLVGAFAAHQKLESLFAALRGDPCRERGALCAPCRSADAVWRSVDEPAPTRLGRYQVQSTLGAGAFGTVYLALDPELNRDVAVKVSSAGAFASAGVFDKFRAEARHAASLNHPNIVTIYDVGREGEQVYIVMQYIAGQTLADAIAAGPLAPDRAAELLATVADALHYAHKLGFVHRDLKPANILLDAHGNPHVADFGLAVSDETQRVLAGQIAGTPAYMSPEQVRGESHRLDGRADVWALGVVLYELVAGRRPFDGQSDRDLFSEIEHRDPKPPRQLNDAIPAELERICLRCLAKRMTDRYSTAADMAADLRDFLSQPKPAPGDRAAIGVPREPPSQESAAPKIIPKGLRSFDAHDADFFLELLPGPTDREGLPESLRFWNTRIEQRDADLTFAVGLIYGPSGCGKTSLMIAGLLPRLAPHVLPVYLEATPDATEAALLRLLRKRSPELAVGGLTAAITELRGGDQLPTTQKVLIVLDQFEQWLHAHNDPQTSELVRALRQCDGGRVQCVVMVRDDFWLAASRFMQALEIPLVERQNSAMVDLFDVPHARKVLALFGRAYGCLPAAGEPSREQTQFIAQAVAELSQSGKVVSVRLALFAEMVKGKPWTPATLKEIGGIAGVGTAFLEETFSAATAPPQHRLHQKAAQAVLKTLLPLDGGNIRSHVRSEHELLAASGYAARPKDFAELTRILDAELRLITPTDPEVADTEGPAPRDASPEKYYQLTHDYLVPSLRDWLTRKQRETRRGRAELRLAERAAAYTASPNARHLPGWWEWPNILLFTRRRTWNAAERRVMRVANRRRGLQSLLVAVLLIAGALAGREARRRVDEEHDRVKADGIVQRLLEAPLAGVPADAAEIEPYRPWTDAKLRQVLADEGKSNAAQRLRASIGLLPVDPAQAEPIYEAMLNCTRADARVLIDVLKPHGSAFVKRLWQLVANQDAPALSRLRAAMALAGFVSGNSEHDRWLAAAPFIVDQLLAEARQDANQYEPLVAALAPAASALLPALGTVFRDTERNPTERNLATSIIAKYAADDPRALVDFINDAEAEQFLTLFPALEKQSDAAIGLLEAELDKKAAFNWHDPPLDRSWQPPSAATVARIEAAGGMIAERFALVQTLPLDEFSALAEELRPSGYRPLRCRPYPVGDHIQVAGVWTRDTISWRSAVDLTPNDVPARDTELKERGYVPVDLAGYATSGGTRAALIWSRESSNGGERGLYGDMTTSLPPNANDLKQKGFLPASLHAYTSPDGSPLYGFIWRKGTTGLDWQCIAEIPPSSYEAAAAIDRLQIDVSLRIAMPTPVKKLDVAAALEAADAALAAKPDDLVLRLQRGSARYDSGDDGGAIYDLDFVAEKASQSSDSLLVFVLALAVRSQAHARLKHAEEARADVAKLSEISGTPWMAAFLDAVVSAHLGDADSGLARLEATVGRHATDARFLQNAAKACSVVAGLVSDNVEQVAALNHRAVDLLELAIYYGWENLDDIRSNTYFDNLRDLPAFKAILAALHFDRHYSAIYEINSSYTSVSPHGLAPEEHLQRCRELAQHGYRPAAISLARALEAKAAGSAPSTGSPAGPAAVALLAASVWHLPRIKDAEKERLAERQANAAAALLRLGKVERVWPLLQHSPDPRLRSWLVHRMALLRVDPKLLIGRLFAAQNAAQPGVAESPSTAALSVAQSPSALALATMPASAPRGASGAETPTQIAVEEEQAASERNRPYPTDVALFNAETSIRRALILALGEFDESQLAPTDRALLLDKLVGLYRSDPDAGMHGAAAWLLRRWRGAQQIADVDGDSRGAKRPSNGRRWYANSQGQTMVVVAGPVEFLMGSPQDERGREIDEPLHKCRIDRSFAIGAHEVTVDQVKRWRPAFTYGIRNAPTGDCPVNGVSWYHAAEYCNWLSQQEGLTPCYEPNSKGQYAEGMHPAVDFLSRDGYRLPTEAEWEFACRAGTTTRRYHGTSDVLVAQYAWHEANSMQTAMLRVGTLKPNDLGLFDMLGNAFEWCSDPSAPYMYWRLDRPRHDFADVSPLSDKVLRLERGATFTYEASNVRSAARSRASPMIRDVSNGFRLARTLSPGSPAP